MKKIRLLFFWVIFLLPFLQSCSDNKVEADLATQVSGAYSLEEISFYNGADILRPNPPLGTVGFRGGDLIIVKETENSCKITLNSINITSATGQVVSSTTPATNTIALSRSSQNGNNIIGAVNTITLTFGGTIATMVTSTNTTNTKYTFKKK